MGQKPIGLFRAYRPISDEDVKKEWFLKEGDLEEVVFLGRPSSDTVRELKLTKLSDITRSLGAIDYIHASVLMMGGDPLIVGLEVFRSRTPRIQAIYHKLLEALHFADKNKRKYSTRLVPQNPVDTFSERSSDGKYRRHINYPPMVTFERMMDRLYYI